MTKKQKAQITNRLKGLAWGLASAVTVTTLAYVIDAVPTIGLPEVFTVSIILIAEQLTKYLNTR